MGTEIRTWQIVDRQLKSIQTSLEIEGRTEPYDLEPWIASNPAIIGNDIAIIGRQVSTKSGPIDLLGIDKSGNTVIIELKRAKLPREALAQAIDYASNAANWSVEKLSEICTEFTGKSLEDIFNTIFPDADIESLNINGIQRILIVGFSIESSLERMIEWLTDTYNVNINAIVLNYTKTSSGDELLTRTSIISEELELERVKKQKKFEIPMSDEPGTYDDTMLKNLLIQYLSDNKITNQRIRDILLPACLKQKVLTREQLKKEFVNHDHNVDISKTGYHLTIISSQLGMTKNDFLRQVIVYEYPNHHWEKDNFSIKENYRNLVTEVLTELKRSKN